ncbi:MAG: penicillin-binding protein activator [Alphaproteobacteria bacterium]
MIKLLLVVFAIAGCVQNTETTKTVAPSPTNLTKTDSWNATQKPHDTIVKIGVMLPLSGQAGKLGNDMKKAINMAIFQSKKKNLIINFYDTQSTEIGTQSAVLDAKKDEVELVIGPVFSKNVKIVSENIDKPIFSFTTDTSVLNDSVFSFGITQQNQLKTLLKNQKALGKNRLGVLLPNNKNAKKLSENINLFTIENGIEITEASYYPMNNLETTREIVKNFSNYNNRRIKGIKNRETGGAYPYDMIFVGGSGSDLEGAISFLRFFEVNPKSVQYLGTSGWDKETSKTLKRTRALVSGLNKNKQNNFSNSFAQNYGYLPKNLAILSYDAMSFISHIASDGSISKYEILDSKGYNGASGLFRFLENGTIEYGLEIRKLSITDEAKIIKSAPYKFY